MRFTPLVLALGLAAATMASAGRGSAPTTRSIRARSNLPAGRGGAAAGNMSRPTSCSRPRWPSIRAIAAPIAWPRRIRQKLSGKAIRLTNKALALEPNDRNALAVQGEAMSTRRACRARATTLSKLQNLCAGPCPQAASRQRDHRARPGLAEVGKPAPVTKIELGQDPREGDEVRDREGLGAPRRDRCRVAPAPSSAPGSPSSSGAASCAAGRRRRR